MATWTPDIATQRLHSQHLARPDFRTPADVVRWFGAVQAQDYLGSLYAVGLRLREGTQATVEKAIADARIIRTWPMRGTIHFVAPEDAPWMLKLLARRGISSNGAMYRRLGLTEAVFARAHNVVVAALHGGKRLTRLEMYRVLEAAGVRTAGEQRGLHILGYLARQGLICLGPRQGKQPTFALLDEWIPAGRRLEGQEALTELARRYFVSHGPATIQDFAWWSGLSLAEAGTGLKAVQSDFVNQEVDGIAYWCARGARVGAAREDVHLLPAFDEFAVAYKNRSAFAYPGKVEAGLLLGPSIILDGRMIGVWRRTLTKDSVVVALDLFVRLNKSRRAAVEKAARRYADFLGVPLVMPE
jgi:hypothetical protein